MVREDAPPRDPFPAQDVPQIRDRADPRRQLQMAQRPPRLTDAQIEALPPWEQIAALEDRDALEAHPPDLQNDIPSQSVPMSQRPTAAHTASLQTTGGTTSTASPFGMRRRASPLYRPLLEFGQNPRRESPLREQDLLAIEEAVMEQDAQIDRESMQMALDEAGVGQIGANVGQNGVGAGNDGNPIPGEQEHEALNDEAEIPADEDMGSQDSEEAKEEDLDAKLMPWEQLEQDEKRSYKEF